MSSIRLLKSGQSLPWDYLINLVGADGGCLPRVSLRDRVLAILIDDLPSPAASILKQCMLSGGADALVHREVLTCNIHRSKAVIYGTPATILRGCYSLRNQPFGLESISEKTKKIVIGLKLPAVLEVNDKKLFYANTPLVMGILNITPDSFSDGGNYSNPEIAAKQAICMEKAGADIIDIGGESTRPGAKSVTAQEQLDRVIPVIEKIRQLSSVPISIDTCIPQVAKASVKAGAGMINSINAMETPGMIDLAVSLNLPVVLMHMKGIPETMQLDPAYTDVSREIIDYLLTRVESLVSKGMVREKIIVDPGIGFGKRLEDNLSLINSLEFISSATGCRVLLGHSRKSFLKTITGIENAAHRDSVTHIVTALTPGVDIVRVHDVSGTVAALKITKKLRRSL